MVSLSLVGFTGCAWFSINSFHTLPIFFIVGAITVLVCGLVTGLFLLQNTAQVCIDSAEIVRKKRSEYFGYNRSRQKYWYWISWLAQRECQLKCGRNFALGRETSLNYLSVLSTNISNAFLLIPG